MSAKILSHSCCLTPFHPAIKQLGGEYADAFSMAAEVMDFAAEEWASLPPGKRGHLMGRLTFEIASAFAGGAIAKVASKADFLTGLMNKPLFQSNRGSGIASKVVNFTQELATTKMCFVAGTLVLTESGLRAIESVHAGERVWSRNETTTVEGWQPVVETFTTHPDTLYTLRLDADGDGHADEETLTCTGEHPFWVEERGAFVPAEEIQPGWRLLRAHGSGQVTVLGIESTRAPPGQTYTTYNFEVATDHTYFVGEAEVWVHNEGKGHCAKVYSLYERFRRNSPQETPWETIVRVRTELLQRAGNAGVKVPSGVFRTAAGEANKEMLEKVAANNLNVSALPSYNKIKTDMPGIYRNPDSSLSNFLGNDTDVDVHHLVEWRFFTRLKPEWNGWTKAQCNEMMPGVMLEVGHHRKLYGALKAIENGIDGKTQTQILVEMRAIYERNDAGHLWPVVQRWCASHGITAP